MKNILFQTLDLISYSYIFLVTTEMNREIGKGDFLTIYEQDVQTLL